MATLSCSSDAGDLDTQLLRQIESQPAPAAADLQHPQSGLEQQLGGDVLLLPQLGGLEIVVTRREIGAGILPVRIQEQFEQLGREIVVMGHVAASTSGRIELLGAAKQMAQAVERPPDVALSGRRQVAAEQIEERVSEASSIVNVPSM